MSKKLQACRNSKEPFRIKKLKGWFIPYGTSIPQSMTLPDGFKVESSLIVSKDTFCLMMSYRIDENKNGV